MTDFLKKYSKEKKMGIVGILGISLVLALGINFFALDNTDIGKNLKASILDINNVGDKADFFLEKNNDGLIIRASKTMEKPMTISISIAYNPAVLDITGFTSDLGDIARLGEAGTGYETIIIAMDGTNDLVADSIVMGVTIVKKEIESTQINMIDANFVDNTGETYILTTSGLTF